MRKDNFMPRKKFLNFPYVETLTFLNKIHEYFTFFFFPSRNLQRCPGWFSVLLKVQQNLQKILVLLRLLGSFEPCVCVSAADLHGVGWDLGIDVGSELSKRHPRVIAGQGQRSGGQGRSGSIWDYLAALSHVYASAPRTSMALGGIWE